MLRIAFRAIWAINREIRGIRGRKNAVLLVVPDADHVPRCAEGIPGDMEPVGGGEQLVGVLPGFQKRHEVVKLCRVHGPYVGRLSVEVLLIIKGMCDANPYVAGRYNIDDYLCSDFLNSGIADWISEKNINTENNRRYSWRENYGDRYATAGSTLRPKVREYFSGASTTASPAISAIRQALDMNNLTTGWQPQSPMVVFHSKYDELVPYVNYERARAAFTGPNFHAVTYDTNVQTHVCTGKSFFTLYLSYYVSSIRNGEADALPHEKTISGKW